MFLTKMVRTKGERKTMSLKRDYFDRNIEICATCMFIDEYSLNVHDDGEVPHGYDGTAVCCKFDNNRKETVENRLWISPCWKACCKYKRCTERQADYLDIFHALTQTIIENPNDISKIE